MGLFLSVLVACAGVIELISVCSNVGRHLTLRPITGNLSQAKENYIKELAEVRKREKGDIQPGDCAKESNSCLERPVPTFRLNSHEDIEIEYNKNVLAKSRTPSPRRFLVIEKEVNDTRESPSPRQFVVSEEPQGLRKSQCQTSIPEFFIQEQKNSKKSPNHPRYVLKDHEGRSASPIPLPSQFLVTEKELAAFQLTDPSSAVARTDSNHGEHCRRSPSPYPPLDLPQTHRNSISKELVDDSVVSILEVDEDLYKSRSPSPREVEENVGITINFETNANLLSSLCFRSISQSQKEKLAATVIERARSISELGSKQNNVVTCSQVVEKATSCSQVNEEGCTDSFSSFAVQENCFENIATYDENYLNNLDGLSKQKFVKRNYTSKRTVKRLSVNNSIGTLKVMKSVLIGHHAGQKVS